MKSTANPQTTWQPIATAPKDGRWIVVFIPHPIQHGNGPVPLVETAKWEHKTWEDWEEVDDDTKKRTLRDDSHWSNYEDPTHWMELPKEMLA